MGWGLANGLYWPLIGNVITGGLLVRLFIIQHDCGHRSFFRSKMANDTIGRFLSFFTFTPYGFWRSTHNMHHAGSGNLDYRGIGSIDTLTVQEFQALPKRKQIEYRIYRHPVMMLLIATPIYMLIIQRIPHGKSSPFFQNYDALSFARSWKSIVGHDLSLLAGYALIIWVFGWQFALFVLIPPAIIAAWVGGWLFYIQHQFEEGYWETKDEWNFHEAAVMGSSYLVLPKILQWFSGNIGLHHIHHLCATIPNYRLQECLDGNECLQNLNRLTIKDSLACLKWRLWCENTKKMVGFEILKSHA
ncbi:MAG: fatty acid desaturase [Micavibrio sp.]|nr:fatty acid desaturase [Micavibrio sp.]|tara:strand:- start:2995 stop:3900 length:906 start_codon:yes stop_codon:yes gene_type:complete